MKSNGIKLLSVRERGDDGNSISLGAIWQYFMVMCPASVSHPCRFRSSSEHHDIAACPDSQRSHSISITISNDSFLDPHEFRQKYLVIHFPVNDVASGSCFFLNKHVVFSFSAFDEVTTQLKTLTSTLKTAKRQQVSETTVTQ